GRRFSVSPGTRIALQRCTYDAATGTRSMRMPMESMQDLYLHELKDLYSAEKQILDALPKMAKQASHAELRRAFEEHQATTEEQVRRLDTIFDDLKQNPGNKKCKGMEGLIEEGEE